MGADGQELHHSGMFQAQPRRVNDGMGRHRQVFAHAAITVDAQHQDARAAVGPPPTAGAADSAWSIGIDSDSLSGSKVRTGWGFHHLPRKFMAHDPWIGRIRLVAFIDMVVSAT